jgi:hypothetical protein
MVCRIVSLPGCPGGLTRYLNCLAFATSFGQISLPGLEREKKLFLEHWDLALILCAAALPPGRSNHGQNRQRLKRRPWHKNSLRVRPLVWRVDEKSFRRRLGKIGRHQAFQHFVIFETQTHPEPLRSRARRKRLARKRLRIAKFAHKINTLDLPQVDGDDCSGSIQQFQLALMHELRRGHVAGDRVPVHLSDDHFFVR